MEPEVPFATSVAVMVPVIVVLMVIFVVAIFRVLSRERDDASAGLDVTYEGPKPDDSLV